MRRSNAAPRSPWSRAVQGPGLAVTLGLGLGWGLGACGDEIEPIEPATTTTTSPATQGDPSGADETGSGGSSTTGPCEEGSESCPCTPGGACDPGLECLSNLCVDLGGTCPVGSEGCPCTPGGGCDPGLACAEMVCGEAVAP